jgi:hypothetical protein
MLCNRAYFSKKLTNKDISSYLKYFKSIAEKMNTNSDRNSIEYFTDNIKTSLITKLQTLSIICTLLSNWAISLYNESSVVINSLKDFSKMFVWMSLMYFFVCTISSLILIIDIQNTPNILLSEKLDNNSMIIKIPYIFMSMAIIHLKISYLLDFMAKYDNEYIYSCGVVFCVCGGTIMMSILVINKSKLILFNNLMKINNDSNL